MVDRWEQVFRAIYENRLNRVTAMIRGGAIGLIYERALSIKEGASDDSAAVTLISNDVDFISFLSDFFHELWAQCLQLVLGMYFLASELGWICMVPICIVVCRSP